MSESLPDDQASIERTFLWSDILNIFRENADNLGVQLSLDPPEYTYADNSPTRVVLAGEIDDGYGYKVRLWGEVTKDHLIGRASVNIIGGQDEFCTYEITPNSADQVLPNPTPLDKEDLQDLRRNLEDCRWDPDVSRTIPNALDLFN